MLCKLEFLYYRDAHPNTYVSMHSHNCYELVYYTGGRGVTTLGEDAYTYTADTFSLICPGVHHDERRDAHSSMLFIGFAYDGAQPQLYNGLYGDARHGVLRLLLAMKDELHRKAPYYQQKLNLHLQEIVIQYARTSRVTPPTGSSMAYIRRFIEENYTTEIDLHTLAALSGYSYHRFRHLFKAQTGLPPAGYILTRRLQKAKSLLANTALSVSAVGRACGFAGDSQFCALFKKQAGLTPGQYRKLTPAHTQAGE